MLARRMQMAAASASGIPWHLVTGVAPWSAYDPAAAASLAASYVDITGNGRDTGVGVAPTHAPGDGWILNGSTQYLITTFVPDSDQSQTVLVQFTDVVGTGGYLVGSTGGAGSRHFFIRPNLVSQVTYRNGDQASASPALTAGNLGIAGNQGYRDGVADGGSIGAWTGAAVALFIGARNNAGSPVDYISCRIQRLIIFDVTLTGPQVAAQVAAMAAA